MKITLTLLVLACATLLVLAISALGWSLLYAALGLWGCIAFGGIALLGVYAAMNYAFSGHALPPEEPEDER